MSNTNHPLWQVMQRAGDSAASDYHSLEARQIRAIADWLVPEEDPFVFETGSANWFYQRTRERLRGQLLAEITRAEAGE